MLHDVVNYRFKRVKNAFAPDCNCFKIWYIKKIQFLLKGLDRFHTRQITFIILNYPWELFESMTILLKVILKIKKGFNICLHSVRL